MANSWSPCKEGSDFSKENNLLLSACNLFDELASSNLDEWRSPNRILEVTIHRVCYPITESVLHQVFSSFEGIVEQILVIGGTDVVMASLVFDSVEAAADAYGELHGCNIYDDCCLMHIKWGIADSSSSRLDQAGIHSACRRGVHASCHDRAILRCIGRASDSDLTYRAIPYFRISSSRSRHIRPL
jgi:hypothetical protein